MTLVRRFALKISNAVVRFASPGWKEWAEGSAGEVAFVKGDCAALGWALGSARVLLDYREAPIASLSDLTSAAEKYAASRCSGNSTPIWIRFLPIPIWFLISADKFFHAANWPERAGCGLAMLGWIAVAISFFFEWRGRRPVPPPGDVAAVLRFYKTGLERVRDFPRSPRGWLLGFGMTAVFVGYALGQHDGIWSHSIFDGLLGLTWMGVMFLVLQGLRFNRRRLEQMEALLAEKA